MPIIMSFQSVIITYTNVLLFYVISFSVLIDCVLIYCLVFIVFYCVAYSLFFFYNFLMVFVRLSLNCIVRSLSHRKKNKLILCFASYFIAAHVISGGRIFGNRIQSNDYFEVIGVTDYRSQKVIVTKYPDPFVRPDAAD